jgi:VWFA-related protein
MNRCHSAPLLLLATALAAAQTTPQPAQSPAQAAAPTLRATARLVIVDVVVTDSGGHPVKGLKSSDFNLTEGKDPQFIKTFEEHDAPTEPVHLPPMPKLAPGVFTNYAPVPVSSAVNVLLLDTLNTPMQDQMFVRQQLMQYLKNAKPGTRIAIFGLTTRLSMLQGFTADPEILKRFMEKKGATASPLLDDAVGGGGVQDSMSDMMAAQSADSEIAADLVYNVASFEAETKSFALQLRARYTLDALDQLARYLVGIPGRKNLIWFSGSFPINILPDPDSAGDPFAGIASAEEEFRETTNLLTKSEVAVYPVDARGLMTSPSFSVQTPGNRYASNPNNFAKDQRAFSSATFSEHSTMYRMADDTGGKAFVNTNGLAEAVAKAIDIGSNYYTLTYTPTNPNPKPDEFHPIRVKVDRVGLTLSYRKGYYTEAADKTSATPTADNAAGEPSVGEAVRAAVQYGAPPATQLIFSTVVRPTGTQPEDTPAQGNKPEPGSKPAHGPWTRYTVRLVLDPHAVALASMPDGQRIGHLQFITLVYDRDGNRINSNLNDLSNKLTPEQYASFLQRPIFLQQFISVPVKGDYRLRVLIFDRNTGHIGSVELPIAAVKNLPSLTAPAAPAPASTATPPAPK